MKRIIFYFSATGNSLYVARQLAGDDGEAVSIPKMFRRKQFSFAADEIGFVFPCLGHFSPNLVKEFVQQAQLRADYFFTVVTYGDNKGNVVEFWDGLTKAAGIGMHYINTVLMVDNCLHHFDIEEELMKNKGTDAALASIGSDLARRRQYLQPTTAEERQAHVAFLEESGVNDNDGFLMRSERQFESSDDCILCGICTKVCPRGCWHLGWMQSENYGQCDYCMACINNCPRKAIKLLPGSKPYFAPEKNIKKHYRNPQVTVVDIEMSNARS